MMIACRGVDQLRGDAHARRHPAHAAFDEVAHAKFAPRADHVDIGSAEARRGIARHHMHLPEARELGDDVLGDAVGEILLFGIAAHVGERQHGDGRSSGGLGRSRRRTAGSPGLHPVCAHRRGNVLEQLLTALFEDRVDLAAHLVMHLAGNAEAARLGQGLEPRRDVDAIAIDVRAFADDVAEVDADAQQDAACLRDLGVRCRHLALQFDRGRHSIDRTGELHQYAVAHHLDDASAMSAHRGLDDQRAPLL